MNTVRCRERSSLAPPRAQRGSDSVHTHEPCYARPMPTLHLQDEDARIVALAVTYHLGRPGSETDPDTLQPHDRGLTSVQPRLDAQLAKSGREPGETGAAVELDVTPYQLHRIDEGLLGVTNELKAYEMANRRSVLPGFTDRITALFPDLAPGMPTGEEAEDDADTALDLVTRVVALRRRIATTVEAAQAQVAADAEAAVQTAAAARRANRKWYQFWIR